MRDDGGQPFAEIVAGGREVLEQVRLLAVGVQRARQGRAEAGDVRAAFGRVDVVDVRVHVLGVLGRVLHGDFEADAVVLAGDVDDVGVGRLRWRGSGARRTRGCRARTGRRLAFAGALVAEDDLHAAVEERQLLQPAVQRVVVELACWGRSAGRA